MLAPKLLKYLPGGTSTPMGYILQPLTNGFLFISGSGNVKQALISFEILHDSRSLAIHGEHYRAFTFLSCFMKSLDCRRNVVNDWMSLVSGMRPSRIKAPY